MAFRPFRKGFSARKRGVRRKSPYETQQLSWCRQGLPLGLSTCDLPDQFFFPLVSGKSEYMVTQPGGLAVPSPPALSAKGVVVKGIKFDYCIGYMPGSGVTPTAGITSIRCGVVLLPVQPGVSSGAGVVTQMSTPPNIFHNAQTDPNANFQTEGAASRVRILWRGMDYMNTITGLNGVGNPSGDLFDANVIASQLGTPYGHLAHRTVSVRNGAVVDMDHGLFFVIEVVNPFLEDNPTLGFDLFGKCGVKPLLRGNRYL